MSQARADMITRLTEAATGLRFRTVQRPTGYRAMLTDEVDVADHAADAIELLDRAGQSRTIAQEQQAAQALADAAARRAAETACEALVANAYRAEVVELVGTGRYAVDVEVIGEPPHSAPQYNATTEVPCRLCGGATIPPTPGRTEEEDYYCEACGTTTAKPTVGLADQYVAVTADVLRAQDALDKGEEPRTGVVQQLQAAARQQQEILAEAQQAGVVLAVETLQDQARRQVRGPVKTLRQADVPDYVARASAVRSVAYWHLGSTDLADKLLAAFMDPDPARQQLATEMDNA